MKGDEGRRLFVARSGFAFYDDKIAGSCGPARFIEGNEGGNASEVDETNAEELIFRSEGNPEAAGGRSN